jgi:hypothetical protein
VHECRIDRSLSAKPKDLEHDEAKHPIVALIERLRGEALYDLWLGRAHQVFASTSSYGEYAFSPMPTAASGARRICASSASRSASSAGWFEGVVTFRFSFGIGSFVIFGPHAIQATAISVPQIQRIAIVALWLT